MLLRRNQLTAYETIQWGYTILILYYTCYTIYQIVPDTYNTLKVEGMQFAPFNAQVQRSTLQHNTIQYNTIERGDVCCLQGPWLGWRACVLQMPHELWYGIVSWTLIPSRPRRERNWWRSVILNNYLSRWKLFFLYKVLVYAHICIVFDAKCHRVGLGLVSRKHHCRNCGQIVCQSCSSKVWFHNIAPYHTIPYHTQNSRIPRYGFEKEVRVCDTCYTILQDPLVLIWYINDYAIVLNNYIMQNICPLTFSLTYWQDASQWASPNSHGSPG